MPRLIRWTGEAMNASSPGRTTSNRLGQAKNPQYLTASEHIIITAPPASRVASFAPGQRAATAAPSSALTLARRIPRRARTFDPGHEHRELPLRPALMAPTRPGADTAPQPTLSIPACSNVRRAPRGETRRGWARVT